MACQSFKLASELTFATVVNERQSLMKLLQNETFTELKLNLCDVKQCDSAGLALLIEAKRLSHQYKKRLEVIQATPDIVALAAFCGVEQYLLREEHS